MKIRKLLPIALSSMMLIGCFNSNKNVDDEFSDPFDDFIPGPAEKLLDDITSKAGVKAKGTINFETDNLGISLSIDARVNIEDLEDIKLNADVTFNFNEETSFDLSLSYFNNTIALDVFDKHLKLATNDLMDFISMIPEYGFTFDNPFEGSDFNLDDFTLALGSLTEESKQKSEGEDSYYYFPLNVFGLDLKIKTTESDDDLFNGIVIDNLDIGDISLNADINLSPASKKQLALVNPLESEDKEKYVDFSSTFNLFDSIYGLIKNPKMELEITSLVTDMNSANNDEYDVFLNLGIDAIENTYYIDGGFMENERKHEINGVFNGETSYIKYRNNKVSLNHSSVGELIEFISSKFEMDDEVYFDEVLETINSTFLSLEVKDVVEGIKNNIDMVNLNENSIEINLDTSRFDVELGVIDIILNFTKDGIENLYLPSLTIGGVTFDLNVKINEYNDHVINEEEYTEIDPILSLVPYFYSLSELRAFNIDFSMILDSKNKEELADMSFLGDISFNVEEEFGFGKLSIKDRDGYNHDVTLDMPNSKDIYLEYNNKMNAKISVNEFEGFFDLISSFIPNLDVPDYVSELLSGEKTINEVLAILLEQMNLEGEVDIFSLLDKDFISNLKYVDEAYEFDLDLETLELANQKIHFTIKLNENELDYIEISNIDVGDSYISFKASVHEYDESKEDIRLDLEKDYISLNEVRILLAIGLETLSNKYIHIKGPATVSALSIFNITAQVDAKIRFEDTLKIDVTIDVPLVTAVNKPLLSGINKRIARIYYDSEFIYVSRTDSTSRTSTTYLRRCNTEFFTEEIVRILCEDILGLEKTILNLIFKEGDTQEKEEVQIIYEDIVDSFSYQEVENDVNYFDLGVNLFAVTGDEMFQKPMNVKLYEDEEGTFIKRIVPTLILSVGIDINIKADLALQDDTSKELLDENKLTQLEEFIESHKDADLNARITL